MTNRKSLRFPSDKRGVILLLVLFLGGIILNLMLIMNPGYFSHDELELLGESKVLSLSGVHWKPPSLGAEYRPVARNFALLVFSLLGNYPQIIHLFNVLIHITIAFLVFHLAGRLAPELGKKFQVVVFLLFVASPMTTFGVGWSAAIYDSMYILFSLIVLWMFIIRNEGYFEGALRELFFFGAVFILSTLALLSKETAVMLVTYVLLLLLFRGFDRKGVFGFIAVGAATALYAAIRFSSLMQIATENTVGYKVSLGKNVAHNFVQYFLYPFTPHVSEIHTIFVLAPKWELLSAAAMHMFIIVMLCRWRVIYAVGYLAAFSVTLLPVLIINMTASHYLYAAAIPLSISLAYLVCKPKHRIVYPILLGSICLLLLHGFANQALFYWTGIHQQKILTSLSTVIRSADLKDSNQLEDKIVIVEEPGSPSWILRRVLKAINLEREMEGVQVGTVKMSSYNDYKNRALNTSDKNVMYLFYHKDGSLLLTERFQGTEQASRLLTLKKYGPTDIKAGQVFNKQPNGESALWAETENATSNTVLVLNDTPLESTPQAGGKLVTATVPKDLYEKSGEYSLYLFDETTNRKSNEMKFIVKP
ncbi:MAG: hypothetical protein H6Q54_313 [Deltaproteobacteria bacterium]|jgi:hypothetical protein|nr:hypothetical protein [Deltaproteobacteria bacterium]